MVFKRIRIRFRVLAYFQHAIAFREGEGRREGDFRQLNMDVSENRSTPKSSIFIGFSIINHPFWGTLIFGNTHIKVSITSLMNFAGWLFFPSSTYWL